MHISCGYPVDNFRPGATLCRAAFCRRRRPGILRSLALAPAKLRDL